MDAKLIVAYDDNSWRGIVVTVPDGIVPEKFHRGSVKWCKTVVKWANENADLKYDGKEIEYVDVLDANPEA